MIGGPVFVADDTTAASSSNASITTRGGIGVARDAVIDGKTTMGDTLTAKDKIYARKGIIVTKEVDAFYDDLTNTMSASVLTSGGIAADMDIYSNQQFVSYGLEIKSDEMSTGPSSGSIHTIGGMGIEGNAYIGKRMRIEDDSNVKYDIGANLLSGSLVTEGGLGVSKDVYILKTLNINDETNAGFYYDSDRQKSVLGGSIATIGGIAAEKDILTNSKFISSRGIQVSSDDRSADASSGSIVTAGGVGVGQNVRIGDTLNVHSTLNADYADVSHTEGSESRTTGSIHTAGGIAAEKDIVSKGYLRGVAGLQVHAYTQSESATTGSVTTAGGAGVARNLYVGENANIASTLSVGSEEDAVPATSGGPEWIDVSEGIFDTDVLDAAGSGAGFPYRICMHWANGVSGQLYPNSGGPYQTCQGAPSTCTCNPANGGGLCTDGVNNHLGGTPDNLFLGSCPYDQASDVCQNWCTTNHPETHYVSAHIIPQHADTCMCNCYRTCGETSGENGRENNGPSTYGASTDWYPAFITHLNPDYVEGGSDASSGSIQTAGGILATKDIVTGQNVKALSTADAAYTAASGSDPASVSASVHTTGGIAADKDIMALQNVKAYGGAQVYATTESTDYTMGSITTAGGLGVAMNINSGGALSVGSTTESTMFTTGSITTAGGLGVTKRINSGGDLSVGGTLSVNTDKFTVADDTGNTEIAGTLSVDSDLSVNTDKFTVAAATGNVEVAGILALTADSGHPFTVNTDKFIVAHDGSLLSAGTIATSGTLTVVESGVGAKFTVYSDTGNVEVAGDISVNTDKFTVAGDTGNTDIAGTLSVDSATDSTASTTGSITTAGGLGVAMDVNVGGDLKVESETVSTDYTTGSITTNGGLGVTKDAFFGSYVNLGTEHSVKSPQLKVQSTSSSLELEAANQYSIKLGFATSPNPDYSVDFFGGQAFYKYLPIQIGSSFTDAVCFRVGDRTALFVQASMTGTYQQDFMTTTPDLGVFSYHLINNRGLAPETTINGVSGIVNSFSTSGLISTRVMKGITVGDDQSRIFKIQYVHSQNYNGVEPFKIFYQVTGPHFAVGVMQNPPGKACKPCCGFKRPAGTLHQKGSEHRTRAESIYTAKHVARILINTTKYHAAKSAPVSAVSVCVARTTNVEVRWVRKTGRRREPHRPVPQGHLEEKYVSKENFVLQNLITRLIRFFVTQHLSLVELKGCQKVRRVHVCPAPCLRDFRKPLSEGLPLDPTASGRDALETACEHPREPVFQNRGAPPVP